uniref:Uncharacterized protein n=2 Tax=Caenorhabditis japonica TaxID=281687 RepID=A0A8R1HNZ6_CAEJA
MHRGALSTASSLKKFQQMNDFRSTSIEWMQLLECPTDYAPPKDTMPIHISDPTCFSSTCRASRTTPRLTVRGEHLPGDVIVVEELQRMPGLLLPEDFHIKPEELLNDARRSYWFIAKYRTEERVLSEHQPFMELGRDYDITKKKRVMANGLMRPVLIRTQQLIPLQRNPEMVVALLLQLMPLQLARGIRPGYQRQRVMR